MPQLVEAYEKIVAEDNRGTRLAYLAGVFNPSEEIGILGSSSPERLEDRIYQPYITSRPPGGHSAINLSRLVYAVDRMAIRGVRYTTQKALERDSDVIFRRNGSTDQQDQTYAGRIVYMFTTPPAHGDSSTVVPYVAIEPYRPLPITVSDDTKHLDQVCRSFAPVGGYLSSSETEGIWVVHASDILCHFAKLSLEEDGHHILHVLQLDRVRRLS